MERKHLFPWEILFQREHVHVPRRGVTRRQMLGTAGAAGTILAVGFPKLARGEKPGSGIPNPIPHINHPPPPGAHFFFPGPADGSVAPTTDPTPGQPLPGRDPSTIYDFNGFIGNADLILSGTGTDTTTHASAPYTFHTDMRFMKGVFIDITGQTRRGAFAFI
jgi:hypothetical protein